MASMFRFVYAARDYEATIGFYRDVLGLPVHESWDDPDGKGTVFEAGSGQVEVLEANEHHPFVEPQGVRMGIEVDDADAWHQRVAAAGGDITQPPTDKPWGHRDIAVRDPNGITITLFTVITN